MCPAGFQCYATPINLDFVVVHVAEFTATGQQDHQRPE